MVNLLGLPSSGESSLGRVAEMLMPRDLYFELSNESFVLLESVGGVVDNCPLVCISVCMMPTHDCISS